MRRFFCFMITPLGIFFYFCSVVIEPQCFNRLNFIKVYCLMKKIYVILAIAALTICAASCGNKKAKEAAEPVAQEAVEAEKSAEDQIKEAATDAAVDVAKTGIAAGAEAVKNEIKK